MITEVPSTGRASPPESEAWSHAWVWSGLLFARTESHNFRHKKNHKSHFETHHSGPKIGDNYLF